MTFPLKKSGIVLGGDDAEGGPETAPQEGQAAHHVQRRHKWQHLGCTDAETFIKYR